MELKELTENFKKLQEQLENSQNQNKELQDKLENLEKTHNESVNKLNNLEKIEKDFISKFTIFKVDNYKKDDQLPKTRNELLKELHALENGGN